MMNAHFCSKCGEEVGDNVPVVLGYYNYLSKNPDTDDIYQLVRMQDKANKLLKEQVNFLTENNKYTKGRYYRKMCHYLRHGRSFVRTLIYLTPEYKEAAAKFNKRWGTSAKVPSLADRTPASHALGNRLMEEIDEMYESIRKKICEEE